MARFKTLILWFVTIILIPWTALKMCTRMSPHDRKADDAEKAYRSKEIKNGMTKRAVIAMLSEPDSWYTNTKTGDTSTFSYDMNFFGGSLNIVFEADTVVGTYMGK